ncbi:amino acid ABC transporter permease [Chthonobacter rhizosphaerae]|uniref:amino acid ABC transporter permease n=1 Tax=Chthonobacter rhizosphaerae TaxID=2735553 RepID=UPI0015EE3992|nr:amino acid ABC transporter permease [Chthonobacter rhizosphaerae]
MTLRDAAPSTPLSGQRGSGSSWLYDPTIRGIVFQVLLVVGLALFGWWVVHNTIVNLRAANIASGFDFLSTRAGYDIAQKPIDYTIDDTHGRAFLVGLLNTLVVAAIGVVLATVLGFLVGIARLSPNWLLAKVASVYVETFRNIPLLLQLLFWYKAVLSVLPGPRQGLALPMGSNLSNRGLIIPRPVIGEGFELVVGAVAVALAAAFGLSRWARARQMATGQSFPSGLAGLALVVLLPTFAYVLAGMPITLEYPELKGFNFAGGLVLKPEFMALLLGLTIYTASFIAEVVRAGVLAVSHGQTEAAYALGLRPSRTLRLVIVPQAMRVIIPPLTSQYLNLTKNSSLAVAVGYPDLVAVFAGSTLNITGRAVEVIFITMSVYLVISLLTAAFMNWFNARVALIER